MSTLPAYVARANVLESEGIWRLDADALELRGGPTAGPDVRLRFPYRDVTGVRLSYAPSRADAARYRCDITLRSGQRLAIVSTHYAGFADFEDRAATYIPFVRELIAKVAAANPRARFRSGKNTAIFIAEHLFLLAMVALLVGVLGLVGAIPLSESTWTKLFIVLGSIPLLIVYFRKNWPRSFHPDASPAEVLPER
ncbi:MAG: hypothetical protein IT536_09870 [Hyphomicrobiales bacterium]|nr:hypothetical protein [Hyphomicrobiales bacterium]